MNYFLKAEETRKQERKEKQKVNANKLLPKRRTERVKFAIDRTSYRLSVLFLKAIEKEALTKIEIAQYLDISLKDTERFLREVQKWAY
jgi:hypothetical protein